MMYDAIIIGCGPAGMTSAIYLARANKKVLILEKETIGGQIASSPLVENYPGFESISGSELANNMFEQITKLNVDLEIEQVVDIKPNLVITEDNEYKASVIIIATGAKYRLLGLPNEENLIGNGIHFCVSCDGAFYQDKVVAVVGGGNTAIVNALFLSDLCQKIFVIQNLADLTCEEALKKKIREKQNIEILYNSTVVTVIGENHLEAIEYKSDKINKINLNGMFISIGLIPQTDIFNSLITLNDYNYVDSIDCKTNVNGIFVAGDCRTKDVRQITTAVNDGTIAAIQAIKYLNK